MDLRKYIIIFMAFLSVIMAGAFLSGGYSIAGDGSGKRGSSEKNAGGILPESPLYKSECSSCHFLYQPWLLPARSWEALIRDSKDHFGEDLALDDRTKEDLLKYLKDNSLENTSVRNKLTKSSGKYPRSIGSSTPKRITEVPYMVKEHDEVKKEVFTRPSIGSHSNCGACHRNADTGDYDEDNVKIPK